MKKIFALVAALLLSSGAAFAQSAPLHYLSAGTNNSTLVRTGKSVLHVVLPINTTSTVYYLKFYNKATAPTCGTDIPAITIPVPNAAGAGGGVVLASTDGMLFGLGLGFCLVGAIADNDNSNAATGVAINIGVGTN